MQDIIQKIENTDWQHIAETMHQDGYALLNNLLSGEQCEALKAGYNNPATYRKTVVMERYRFGLGTCKYYNYPLPRTIHTIRIAIYPRLAPLANAWFKALDIGTQFPLQHPAFLQQCHQNGQQQPAVLLLKYGKGGFNTLHRDLYGTLYFPIQIVLMLSEPGKDFTGGEFVLTQQVPGAQSKAIVLQPRKGDVLIFTTNFKPGKGTRGYYRAHMKHGVSTVTSGERYAPGIIFHDAVS